MVRDPDHVPGIRLFHDCLEDGGGSVHSLKYVVGRHWLRTHTTLVLFIVMLFGIAIYLLTR